MVQRVAAGVQGRRRPNPTPHPPALTARHHPPVDRAGGVGGKKGARALVDDRTRRRKAHPSMAPRPCAVAFSRGGDHHHGGDGGVCCWGATSGARSVLARADAGLVAHITSFLAAANGGSAGANVRLGEPGLTERAPAPPARRFPSHLLPPQKKKKKERSWLPRAGGRTQAQASTAHTCRVAIQGCRPLGTASVHVRRRGRGPIPTAKPPAGVVKGVRGGGGFAGRRFRRSIGGATLSPLGVRLRWPFCHFPPPWPAPTTLVTLSGGAGSGSPPGGRRGGGSRHTAGNGRGGGTLTSCFCVRLPALSPGRPWPPCSRPSPDECPSAWGPHSRCVSQCVG